jgi:putative transposase
MSKKLKSLVKFHVSLTELNDLIFKLEKVAKKVNRLHFIRQLYEGKSVKEARLILGIPEKTAYNWLEKWNDEGANGLNHKKGAGRPPFLSETQFEEVCEFIKNNDSLGTKDVHYFIEKNYDIDYSLKQVRKIIKKLEYSWIKPYPIFSKSPENAKEIMKEDASDIDPEEDIYGFFDESAMQNLPNISRVLKKKEKNVK